MKTYQNVVVLNCDGRPDSQGDMFHPEFVKIPVIPVVVTSRAENKVIGTAVLRKEQNQILADITIFNEEVTGLYPAIGAVVLDEVFHQMGISIRTIILGQANFDRRIEPIGKGNQ